MNTSLPKRRFVQSTVLIFAVALATAVAGCGVISTKFGKSEVNTPLISNSDRPEERAPTTDAYIREVDEDKEVGGKKVSADNPSISITALFDMAVPEYPLWVQDAGVDPHHSLAIHAYNVPLNQFLDIVSNLTGYDFVLKTDGTPHIEVASVAHRQWALAALSSARSAILTYGVSGTNGSSTGGSGGSSSNNNNSSSNGSSNGSNSISTSISTQVAQIKEENKEGDGWDSVIVFLKQILGDAKPQAGPVSGPDIPTHVVALRTLGLIDVTGPPVRIREIDRVISEVVEKSTEQLHLAVNVFEVTLNDDRQEGIDWSTLLTYVKGNMGLQGAINLTNPIVGGVANAGTGTINLGFVKGNQSITNVISLLGQYGKVGTFNRPDVLVTNGRTASIQSGTEFSFIQSVTSSLNTNSNFQSSAPVFTQVLVGVELDVTPRVDDRGRIVLDIVPVLSTLNGYDNFQFAGVGTFQEPRIAINQMATQVVARSGETILMGGLIFRAINDTVSHLPGDQSFLDSILGSTSTELQRHELILTITPTLVDS